jgi:hypothetical protein
MLNNLDFLEKFSKPKKNRHDVISFFKSSFEANIWTFELNKKKKSNTVINFNVKLSDESLLTDSKNYKTLYTFKTLIIDFLLKNDMYLNAEETIVQGLHGIIHFFNIINTYDEGSFAQNGFNSLDRDHLLFLFNKRLQNNNLFYVYNGQDKLNRFLSKIKYPTKEAYTSNDVKLLNKTIQEGKYDLQKELFPNLLLPIQFSLENILLNQNKNTKYIREYEGFFRNNEKSTISVVNSINPMIKALSLLLEMHSKNDNNYSLPFKSDLEFILNYDFNGKQIKHFETYPIQTILTVLNKSLEFHFNYGDSIVQSFTKFINKIKENDLNEENLNIHTNKKNQKITDDLVLECIDEKLKLVGINSYYLPQDKDYFNNLRSNKSLLGLLKTYYGVAQFVTGALLARRQSEIDSMEVDCFDEDNLQIMFRKSKSYQHSFGVRDCISLPCPEIVIGILKNINQLAKLITHKAKTPRIFFMPNSYLPCYASTEDNVKMYENLDTMYDYFNVDLIDEKRPYIRQHQLRRFFAMAFFWSKGFKSIDTLRWFLGHTNAEHVYHYIRENNDGSVLNNVKAQYIAENIKEYESLSDIFSNKFNVNNYNLLNKEDLADYINTLLEDGLITVEPEFFEDDKGNQFEIILKVKNND